MEEILNKIHLTNELFSILAFIFCGLMLIKIFYSTQKQQFMDWTDLLTVNGESNKVSFHKLFQLIAMFVSTWIIIHLTIFDRLSSDLLGVYLAYSGGNEAFSKYLSLKREALIQQK